MENIKQALIEFFADFLDSEDVRVAEAMAYVSTPVVRADDDGLHLKMAEAAFRVYRDSFAPDAAFSDEFHENFKPDFGFTSPVRAGICSNPAYSDPKLHRIALMKDEHFGSPGDQDEGGLPGWTSKYVCVGCGKKFKIRGFAGMFHPD